jgi:glycosyltransferase 2 family protein
MKKWPGTILKTVLPLLLGFYLVWYFFDSMSEETKTHFYRELKEANYLWIVLSLVISFAGLLSRAYRWKFVLEPLGYQTHFRNRYHAMMIGYVMNLTIPRAGEATRALMLYRSDGVPFSKSVGTIIGERAVDLVMLLGIAALAAAMGYEDFSAIRSQMQAMVTPDKNQPSAWITIAWYAFLLLVAGFFLAVLFLGNLRRKALTFMREVVQGVFSIFRSKNPGSYLLHTFVIWGSYVAYFWISFWSLEETSGIPASGMLIAFVAGSLGITFTNGGVGAFPLVVGLVVAFYLGASLGESTAKGVGYAIGMIIWASQTLMMIVLGLLSLVLIPRNYTSKNEQTV